MSLVAGTLPTAKLLSSRWHNGCFSTVFQSINRNSYSLQYKNTVMATNWTTISTNLGNGALKLLSDPAATNSQRYYRLKLD